MRPAGPSCVQCGAVLASDQEYCLECGTRRLPPHGGGWRVPLVAAAVTVALAVGVLLLVYDRMRDDADSDAAQGEPRSGRVVKPTPASGRAIGSGAPQPVPVAPPPRPASP